MIIVPLPPQTQEREAKAEMRRKAKELQQARRDAERSGKKAPGFGGFGSSGMTGGNSATIITDALVEPEKPKVTPASTRYVCSSVCSGTIETQLCPYPQIPDLVRLLNVEFE